MRLGTIAAIALKRAHRAPMEEVAEAVAEVDGGLQGCVKPPARRGVTFISKEQWAEVQQNLDTDIPWHSRRANVLTEGVVMAELLGKTIRVGAIRLRIEGETEPCQRMEAIHTGLQSSLEPACRGGVYGRVLQGGSIRVGDSIEVVE